MLRKQAGTNYQTAPTAQSFVEQGNFFWNSGMFFWRASTVLDLIRHHLPKTATLLAGLPLSEVVRIVSTRRVIETYNLV
jgi:mannose-1-phosphate guanylyltransferase